MKRAVRFSVCTFLSWNLFCGLALAQSSDLVPFTKAFQPTDVPESPDSGSYHSIFVTSELLGNRSEKSTDNDWIAGIFDPWGFTRLDPSSDERIRENRLRQLEENIQSTINPDLDPLSELYQHLQSKREPTGKLRIRQTLNEKNLLVKAKFDISETQSLNTPYLTRDWWTEESVRMHLPGMERAFVFGHFTSSADSLQYSSLSAVAKTGFGLRWTPWQKGEFVVRGGPMVTYSDRISTMTFQERSHMAVEVLASTPLFGSWTLDYFGGAFAASLPTDSNFINHEVRVALPLKHNSEFYFGLSQTLDAKMGQAEWTERNRVYIGIELKR